VAASNKTLPKKTSAKVGTAKRDPAHSGRMSRKPLSQNGSQEKGGTHSLLHTAAATKKGTHLYLHSGSHKEGPDTLPPVCASLNHPWHPYSVCGTLTQSVASLHSSQGLREIHSSKAIKERSVIPLASKHKNNLKLTAKQESNQKPQI
jgi:hypothetical protein